MSDDADAKPFMTMDEFRIEEVGAVWRGLDLETVGRVLRAHLVVEYFMNELLKAKGHDLAELKSAGVRVTFVNKLRLLYPSGYMRVGINGLNEIRNKFAHQPAHRLSDADTAVFFDEHNHFRGYLKMSTTAKGITAPVAIDTVEAFAEWAAVMMQSAARAIEKIESTHAEYERQMLRLEGKQEAFAELTADDP